MACELGDSKDDALRAGGTATSVVGTGEACSKVGKLNEGVGVWRNSSSPSTDDHDSGITKMTRNVPTV